MKIKNITMSTDLNDTTIDFINESMEKQSLNDVMLNNHHLLIHLDGNETFKPIQLLYRNLWQTAYLNDPSFFRYNRSIISISLSAQIALFPLILFHTNKFGIYFLITNFFINFFIKPFCFSQSFIGKFFF